MSDTYWAIRQRQIAKAKGVPEAAPVVEESYAEVEVEPVGEPEGEAIPVEEVQEEVVVKPKKRRKRKASGSAGS